MGKNEPRKRQRLGKIYCNRPFRLSDFKMTRISTIHGIGQDEFAGRAAEVTGQSYIPYLSLTKGEMELYLAAQKAKILAQWYGNAAPQYRDAEKMIYNALNTGVHGGIKFIGVVPDHLQNVAAMIKKAESQRQPASRALFYRPGGIVRGIGEIIPLQQRRAQCLKYANEAEGNEFWRRLKKCNEIVVIEKILNASLEKSSHHVIYKQMPSGYLVPHMGAIKQL